ncbi:MAG: C40 family peptidase [Bacteroidetes bacterium]|nr:C40 family peptidase [Bacteroidota bacterium]
MKGIVLLSAVPMRKEASDRSEIVNQILYGETFEILQQEEKWSKIKLHHDNYEGWIDNKQWKPTKQKSIYKHFVHTLFLKKSNIIFPLGALVDFPLSENKKSLLQTARLFLNTPYLWGGRTFSGIDCSGFMQVIFRTQHIALKRDAYQQQQQGKRILFQHCATNDLAFFHNKEGKVMHVGLIIREKNKVQIIHASGFVRIDDLDETGIYNKETKTYTHQLHSIKRIIK